MSFTYQIRSAKDVARWPVSGPCAAAAASLARAGLTAHLAAVGLAPDAETGVEHRLDRRAMLDAIETLIGPARQATIGYQVRYRHAWVRPADEESVARAISGVRIGGGNYYITCGDSDWAIVPHATPPTAADPGHPAGLRGERRTGPAEFATENRGIVRVEAKRRNPALATLLSRVRAFARSGDDETLAVTVG